ncbi:MAG: hypothetical protein JSR77_15505 [Planctomycetes bacterium]|nr:hypothetical protein [Planctomycetota bacterium]
MNAEATHPIPTCNKCGVAMAAGNIPEFRSQFFDIGDTQWVSAEAMQKWNTSLFGRLRGIPIAAFRCPKCGLIELYAIGEAP